MGWRETFLPFLRRPARATPAPAPPEEPMARCASCGYEVYGYQQRNWAFPFCPLCVEAWCEKTGAPVLLRVKQPSEQSLASQPPSNPLSGGGP